LIIINRRGPQSRSGELRVARTQLWVHEVSGTLFQLTNS